MNIGAEIPFRRSRRSREATGSLILDRRRTEHLRQEGQAPAMRVWSGGHFREQAETVSES